VILERLISMTNAVAPLITIPLAAPAESGEAQAPLYRLRKSFAAVHFEPSGKGRIAFLREGIELSVVGPSRLSQCCEVLYEAQFYNMFEADLLGPWASRLKRRVIRPVTASAVAACA
jgi:hypothetical protein